MGSLALGALFLYALGTQTGLSSRNVPLTPSHPTPDADRDRIGGLVGPGGMGEVYRADDRKLGQPVALKSLPEEVERNSDRLQRLLNEVRLALRITQPNVASTATSRTHVTRDPHRYHGRD